MTSSKSLTERGSTPAWARVAATLARQVRFDELAARDVHAHPELVIERRGPRSTGSPDDMPRASTHDPMGTIIPVCSATSRNDAGSKRPRVGCCHRSSASTLTVRRTPRR